MDGVEYLFSTVQGVESAEKTGAAARKAADRDTADMEAFLQVRQRIAVPFRQLTARHPVYCVALVTTMLCRLSNPHWQTGVSMCLVTAALPFWRIETQHKAPQAPFRARAVVWGSSETF